jgi:hypothetical protein
MKSKIINILAVLAFACAALFALPACNSTATTPAAKLVVQYAVLKVADKNPQKAAKVADIAKEVRALAGSEGFNTVDLLVAAIRAKVDFSKLDAADTLLANALIDTVSAELKSRVGSEPLADGALLKVNEVAAWIIDAAALAGA